MTGFTRRIYKTYLQDVFTRGIYKTYLLDVIFIRELSQAVSLGGDLVCFKFTKKTKQDPKSGKELSDCSKDAKNGFLIKFYIDMIIDFFSTFIFSSKKHFENEKIFLEDSQ